MLLPRDPALRRTAARLDCWYLTGPTASGKTSIGVELALLLNAEIISLDSMALYREMDIGTAKPTADERAEVPHHLLDLLSPTEEFSVSNYCQAALDEDPARSASAGREVLFVGGTPLYLKAMLRGMFRGPPADWEFRAGRSNDEVQDGRSGSPARAAAAGRPAVGGAAAPA